MAWIEVSIVPAVCITLIYLGWQETVSNESLLLVLTFPNENSQ